MQKADEMLLSNKNIEDMSVDIFLKICDFYESEGNEQKLKHYQKLMYRKLKEGFSDENVWRWRSAK